MRTIALIFLVTACAKAPSEQTTAVTASPAASAVAAASLAQSEKLDAGAAIQAASQVALGAPNSFPAATALRCWRREEPRRAVRDACLLAWAAAGQDSTELTEVLHQTLDAPTRQTALAAARRVGFAKTLTSAELLTLNSALLGEEPWIRARVALDWLSGNKPSSIMEAVTLLNALKLPDTGSPITFASKFAVTRRLGLGTESSQLQWNYCTPGATGPILTRCLRALSALTNPRFGPPAPYVGANLPSRNDPGTTLFHRSFPSRAHDLDNLYK